MSLLKIILPALAFITSHSAVVASEDDFSMDDSTGHNLALNQFPDTQKQTRGHLSEHRYDDNINNVEFSGRTNELSGINNPMYNQPQSDSQLKSSMLAYKPKFDIDQAVKGFMSYSDNRLRTSDQDDENSSNLNCEIPSTEAQELPKQNISDYIQKNDQEYMINISNAIVIMMDDEEYYSYCETTLENNVVTKLKKISVRKFSPARNRQVFERKEITEKFPHKRPGGRTVFHS